MSMEGAVTFHERLITDEEFQQRAAAAIGKHVGYEATEALVAFAVADGLDVTASELRTVQGTMIGNDELSDEHLETVAGGKTAQLANIDLQNMLQKQQQTLQMMSNISKALHDSAMAVIRKIGA